MTNKTKQNRKNRDNNNEDDEYVYPTKRVKNNTRNRRSDKNLINKGLVDLENTGFDDFEEGELSEWYDDTPMASDEDIAAEFANNSDEKDLFESYLSDDFGYEWEDF